jgi:hypothetical protein
MIGSILWAVALFGLNNGADGWRSDHWESDLGSAMIQSPSRIAPSCCRTIVTRILSLPAFFLIDSHFRPTECLIGPPMVGRIMALGRPRGTRRKCFGGAALLPLS